MKVRFSGGLGNQLYQLGFLWHLQKAGISVEPDFCEYTYYDFHCGLELNKVLHTQYDDCIKSVESSRRNWYKLFNEKLGFWLRFHYHRLKSKNKMFVEDETRQYEILDFSSLNKNTVLKGHWQKTDYLSDVTEIFHKSLSYDLLNTERDSEIKHLIETSESVSIHVRRGDYLNDSFYSVIKGMEYYRNAISIIKEKYPNAKFFVFSDDIEYVRENLLGEDLTFVDWNKGKDSFKDLLLMSLCQHNIIANSTFSWWGAYLNPYPDKIVICPSKWSVNGDMQGRCPNDWIKLDA